MAKVELAILKEHFETGDMPTGTDFVDLIDTLSDTDVATTDAKGLMSATDKIKLDGVEAGATNYQHPANHAPSIITQDETNRFVTDTEKTAWNGKQAGGLLGEPSGIATLGSDGKLTTGQIPAITITDTFVVASQAEMLAIACQTGDVAVRSDLSKTFILKGADPTTLANWQELATPTDVVLSVAGKAGVVSLVKDDVGLANVDNTSDANKPVSSATTTALGNKADLSGGKLPSAQLSTMMTEVKTAPAISAGALTLNCANGNVFAVALNAAITTLTLSNAPATGTAYGMTVAFTADGTARAITWPGSVKWAGGTAPTLTSTNAKVDIFVFVTWDGGTTWYAHIAGQNM